jgi:predicted ATP-dependent endonuclease of OLD family
MIAIKKIKFNNHFLFGNQEFIFYKENYNYKNIVFAGENGTGKTTILNIIDETLKSSYYLYFDSANLETSDTFITLDITDLNYMFKNRKITEARLCKCKDKRGNTIYNVDFPEYDPKSIEDILKDGQPINYPFEIDSLYSKVEINYTSRNDVNSLFGNDVDKVNLLASNDIAHDVIKLLCTISMLDNNDFRMYYEENGEIIDDSMLRKTRFNNALAFAFNNSLEYKGLKNGEMYKPLFLINNKDVEIEKLSSGQKQIVFRGASLLHNINSVSGYPILIDEPELSMHPIWEQKIYGFYKNLFMIDNKQTSQIFYATHSEHLLNDAMNDESCMIVKLNNMNHVVIDDNNSVLPTLTLGEIKFSIFNLSTIDFHTSLYAFIGNNIVTSEKIIDIDSYLASCANCPLKSYQWIERNGRQHNYKALSTYIRNCI